MKKDVEIRQGGECLMYVEGLEMPCPLCGTLVRSGEHHHCKVATPEQTLHRRPRRDQKHGASK